ncbi:hypothetical protein MRB53_021010 [Persea americana]|uniref:Uncharacterized protein n=1 Tax=Persea americana TaxID=3435 RepID=A0ACC2L3U5_PERAE|nr:hypothetical protein MRB53_021010 [Persea americana]
MIKRVKKRRERATRNVAEPERDKPKKQEKVAKDKIVSQSNDFVDINEKMERKATTKSDKKKPFKLVKNSITKLLNEAEKKMLKLIYDTDGYKATVWGGESESNVLYEDIIAILSSADISSSVIDSFTQMLDKEQTDLDNALKVLGNEGLEEDEKSYFITSLCWTTLTAENKIMIRDTILNHQMSPYKMQSHRVIHFPMNSNGRNKDATPFHWTLLLLDRKQCQWMHYNSLRLREKNTIDLYFKDAELLLDCGMIVCYIMTQIARCKPVNNHLAQSVINSFRAEATVKFLHDEPRTWTKEDFEAKKFASLKEG